MAERDSAGIRARIEHQITLIGRLRGTGPNPFEYNQWDDRTVEILEACFGADSPELASYLGASGTRGRLPGVRGQAENMTLNIHGQWGILGRLERGERVLVGIAAQLPRADVVSA